MRLTGAPTLDSREPGNILHLGGTGTLRKGELAMSDITMSTKHRFLGMPESWLGWTSIVLAVLSAAGIFGRRAIGGFRGVFTAWIVAGAVALVAVLWQKERSVLVWIPLVAGLLAALWLGAELVFPH